jgi:hypothetical protein
MRPARPESQYGVAIYRSQPPAGTSNQSEKYPAGRISQGTIMCSKAPEPATRWQPNQSWVLSTRDRLTT